jgi:hypothetical protein
MEGASFSENQNTKTRIHMSEGGNFLYPEVSRVAEESLPDLQKAGVNHLIVITPDAFSRSRAYFDENLRNSVKTLLAIKEELSLNSLSLEEKKTGQEALKRISKELESQTREFEHLFVQDLHENLGVDPALFYQIDQESDTASSTLATQAMELVWKDSAATIETFDGQRIGVISVNPDSNEAATDMAGIPQTPLTKTAPQSSESVAWMARHEIGHLVDMFREGDILFKNDAAGGIGMLEGRSVTDREIAADIYANAPCLEMNPDGNLPACSATAAKFTDLRTIDALHRTVLEKDGQVTDTGGHGTGPYLPGTETYERTRGLPDPEKAVQSAQSAIIKREFDLFRNRDPVQASGDVASQKHFRLAAIFEDACTTSGAAKTPNDPQQNVVCGVLQDYLGSADRQADALGRPEFKR